MRVRPASLSRRVPRLEILEARQLLSATLGAFDPMPLVGPVAPAEVQESGDLATSSSEDPTAPAPPTPQAPDAITVVAENPGAISLAYLVPSLGLSHGRPAPEGPTSEHPLGGPEHFVLQPPTNVPFWVLQNGGDNADPHTTPSPVGRPTSRDNLIGAPNFGVPNRTGEADSLTSDRYSHRAGGQDVSVQSQPVAAAATREVGDSLASSSAYPTGEEAAATVDSRETATALVRPPADEAAPRASGDTAMSAAPVTRSADLLPGMVAFDTAALDRAIVEFSAQMTEVRVSVRRFLDERGLAPWVVAAAIGVVAGEIGRRRLQPRRPARFYPQGTLTSDPSTWISGLGDSLGTEVL